MPGHIISLAVQQIVRELQKQAPQGAHARRRLLAPQGRCAPDGSATDRSAPVAGHTTADAQLRQS